MKTQMSKTNERKNKREKTLLDYVEWYQIAESKSGRYMLGNYEMNNKIHHCIYDKYTDDIIINLINENIVIYLWNKQYKIK